MANELDMLLAGGGLMALGMGILIAILAVLLFFYVFNALAVMTIAKKSGVKNAWLAWIPIGDIYLLTQVGGQSGWWTLIVLTPLIPMVGPFLLVAGLIYIWWKVCEARNKPAWLSLLVLLSGIGYMILEGVVAWSKD